EFRFLGNSTAYAPGSEPPSPFAMYAIGVTGSPDAHVAVNAALDGIVTGLAPFASERVLLNFVGDGDVGEDRTRAAFSEEEFLRLQKVKAAYDPGNRFRFNHNIPPMRIVVESAPPGRGMPRGSV